MCADRSAPRRRAPPDESRRGANAWALGLAGTQGAGLWAFNADGTMSKRLHAGQSGAFGRARRGTRALGFTGPTQIYEYADGGVLKAFSDDSDPAPLTADLGRVFHLDTTSIKPYCCCGSTHSYIDAALALRAKLGAPWDVSARARRHREGRRRAMRLRLCGRLSALNAQMSLRYVVAAALLEGQALPAQFTDEKLADPALVTLAQSRLVPDPELDELYPKEFAGLGRRRT